MSIFSSIILALIASLDSLIIGIAYGVKNIKISFAINTFIASIVTLGTFLSMYLGLQLCSFLDKTVTTILGSSLLILIGFWMVFDYFHKHKKEVSNNTCSVDIVEYLDYDNIMLKDKTADIDGSGAIELKEGISLAIALSLNNFSLGLGASIAGICISTTTIFTFIFSIIMVVVGLSIGNSVLSKFFGKISSLFSAIIIIIMGIWQILSLYL